MGDSLLIIITRSWEPTWPLQMTSTGVSWRVESGSRTLESGIPVIIFTDLSPSTRQLRARSPLRCYHHHADVTPLPPRVMPPPDSLPMPANSCNPDIYANRARKVSAYPNSRQKQLSSGPQGYLNGPKQRFQEMHDMKHDSYSWVPFRIQLATYKTQKGENIY